MDAGLVRGFGDLYRLQLGELVSLKRRIKISPEYAKKLLERIVDSKKRGLARLLNAISIRHVGQRVAGILAQGFHRIDELQGASIDQINSMLRKGRRGDIDEPIEVDQGQSKESQVIARSVHEFFRSDLGIKTIASLVAVGVEMAEKRNVNESRVLEGKVFVITGTLKKYTRDEIQQHIIRNGGQIGSGVSGKTDYLVVGESPGTKLEKAKAVGTKVLTEEEFDRLLN
jgi:DNA ligase (NAD+)